jgi:hypothetical protein
MNSEGSVGAASGGMQDENAPEWLRQAQQRQAQGYFFDETPKEKAERLSKDVDNVRKTEEAKLEREKLRLTGPSGAPIRKANPEDIILEVAMSSDDTAKITYLMDPWLPHGQVVGFFGRGETAKSSFVATLAAQASEHASTLWISTEEPTDWIAVRHMKAGGEEASLFIYKALVTKTDPIGRAIASSFNVYEHLEAAIMKAKTGTLAAADALSIRERPLRLVVLDTAVALTTWGKSESPNDDASVKRLLAFLLGMCEKHGVTIAIIGHSNKGKHDNLTDTVAGSAAWVNSPRQAFTHIRDKTAEYTFVVCTVKSTLTGTFAAQYTTRPIHTLATRPDGRDSVLCEVQVAPIEWGFEDAMELVNAALDKDQETDDEQLSSKDSRIARIISAVIHLLTNGSPRVDREMVETTLGAKQNRRHWQEADQTLSTGHNVLVSTGPHGKIFYEWK